MAPTSKLSSATNVAVQDARQLALPVVALGVVIAILYFGRMVFITAIIAVIIAFILEPFVTLLMRLRLPRSLASFVVCSLAVLALYIAGLAGYAQLSGLYDDLPKYGQRVGDIVDGVRQRIQGVEDRTYKMVLPARVRKMEEERLKAQEAAAKKKGARGAAAAPALPPPMEPQPEPVRIGDYLYSHLSSFYELLLMASFIPFLVYFMLSWRDHINRSFLQFFHGEERLIAARSLTGIAEMVRAFVVGNFVLGLLLAVLSSVAFWLIDLPYPFLVGPISGILSLLPYVGLPMAMAPPLLAALTVTEASVYIAALGIAAALHLIAMNLLYPKVVGSRVHLNPLVVTFCLMLWGFLWGAAGLVLAIPLTAGIKAVCDNVRGLRPFGKFLGD